jgi:hypothetical protein
MEHNAEFGIIRVLGRSPRHPMDGIAKHALTSAKSL